MQRKASFSRREVGIDFEGVAIRVDVVDGHARQIAASGEVLRSSRNRDHRPAHGRRQAPRAMVHTACRCRRGRAARFSPRGGVVASQTKNRLVSHAERQMANGGCEPSPPMPTPGRRRVDFTKFSGLLADGCIFDRLIDRRYPQRIGADAKRLPGTAPRRPFLFAGRSAVTPGNQVAGFSAPLNAVRPRSQLATIRRRLQIGAYNPYASRTIGTTIASFAVQTLRNSDIRFRHVAERISITGLRREAACARAGSRSERPSHMSCRRKSL